jgi:hypothetical protein
MLEQEFSFWKGYCHTLGNAGTRIYFFGKVTVTLGNAGTRIYFLERLLLTAGKGVQLLMWPFK